MLTPWLEGRDSAEIREAAVQACDRYQKCGIKGARTVFGAGG